MRRTFSLFTRPVSLVLAFIVTFPGTVVEAHDGGKNPVSTLASPEQIRSCVKSGGWNQVEIIADGHLLVHLINGHITSMTIDNDGQHFSPKGLTGLEIEGPGVLKFLTAISG